MRVLSVSQAEELMLRGLGVGSAYTLHNEEFVATLIRRTASFSCPCTRTALAKAVLSLVRPLYPEEDLGIRIHDCLDELLAYGDLIEIRDQEDTRDLVTIAVPSAVKVSSRRILLVGLAPGDTEPVPNSLATTLRLHGCVRSLSTDDADATMSELLASGHSLLTYDDWSRPPRATTADDLIVRYTRQIATQQSVGSLGELELLLPDTDVKYYRGRWKTAKTHTGIFVAKRERRFGSPSWCFVRLESGQPSGLVSFPTRAGLRGCDEAWHLQQAIDSKRSAPQRFQVRLSSDGLHGFLDLYSPIPEWAQRRWNALGDRVSAQGCLLSYRFDSALLADEIQFSQTRMWLTNDDRTHQ